MIDNEIPNHACKTRSDGQARGNDDLCFRLGAVVEVDIVSRSLWTVQISIKSPPFVAALGEVVVHDLHAAADHVEVDARNDDEYQGDDERHDVGEGGWHDGWL